MQEIPRGWSYAISQLYFAYGSNLCSARLRQRAPSARSRGRAFLPGHALRFRKRGRDGSGKCDAFATGSAGDVVWGALYEIASAERPALDRAEGLGRGYGEALVALETDTGARHAFTYRAQASHVDPDCVPFRWYRALVLAGAREHGLPESYVRALGSVPVREDPDPARRAWAERLLARVAPEDS